jgi:metallo-beta-lactamase family protein
MKFITFLGASGTVTGSSYFLHDTSGQGILIDLGMFQGRRQIEELNYQSIPLHPNDINGVFLTHAHLDHSGRLPLLRRFGYRGPIYMTTATKTILELTLRDAAKIQTEREGEMALYDERDVDWVLSKAVVAEYNDTVKTKQFDLTFRNAGHILGSAFFEVRNLNAQDSLQKIVFSGDIGNYPEDLVKPTDIVTDADLVLIESTYGDKSHSEENPRAVIQEEIAAIEATGGTLLIPAFSIERTQEILHHIDHLKKTELVRNDTKVFLDSPLAIHVTRVYQQYRSLYNTELTNHAVNDDPFEFPGLVMVEDSRESREILKQSGPKVIIAGSGMMNGGRILRHAVESLGDPTTRLLFVGFQAEGTLGRALLDGEKNIRINSVPVDVQATIRKSSSMSSHADQPKLLQWLSSIPNPAHICFVHGENPQRQTLAEKVKQTYTNKPILHLPMLDDTLAFSRDDNQIVTFGSSSGKRKTKTPSVSRYTTISA